MVRNRPSSYAESSDDDDFAVSDDDKSSSRSRLKRPRRSSNKPRRLAVRSPQTSSFHQEHNDDEVICVPDSLEHEDSRLEESDELNVEKAPRDPSAENTMESVPKSEEPAVVEENENNQPASVAKSSPAVSVRTDDQHSTRSSRATRKRKTYVISDSESDASVHEDDDAYNSADDSPNDVEAESDFERSPKKTAKKRTAVSQPKRGTPPKRTRTQPAPKKSTAKKARQIASTATKATVKTTTASKPSTVAGKKRLGARIPCNSSSLSSLSTSTRRTPGTSLKSHPSPLIRSGLSRNAAVPRLHAYLGKK